MPYTLAMGLLWVVLAALVGVVIGWLLRSVAAKRQVERARAANLGTAERDELESLRAGAGRVTELEADRDRLAAQIEQMHTDAAVASIAAAPEISALGADDTLVDASRVLGRPVRADDLTVIEGIGDQIAELCHGIGISTWAELANTEVSLLKAMLTDAGQRVKAHNPSTWPDQAALLAAGDWAGFVALLGRLDSGRVPD